jgi:N-acetylglucosamine-6-phosphate deacetylase
MVEYVLFHTHGLAGFDFSVVERRDLQAIDKIAAERHAYLCATVFLQQDMMGRLRRVLTEFAEEKSKGAFHNLLGFAVEGPVLGPRGGTPRGSVWRPTTEQWVELVSWFDIGLKYIVISPDVVALNEELDTGFTFADLISQIYEVGGRVALGHFARRDDPAESANRIQCILRFLEARYCPSPYLVLTDHLFNDMPLRFRHAFRTEAEKLERANYIAPILNTPWVPSTLPNLLGEVPAALLIGARERRLTPSINFDGSHVDLDVCKNVVNYLGASRLIAITDHTDVFEMAGERLSAVDELLYRSDGILAASRVGHEQQRANMVKIGLSEHEIQQLFFDVPLAALQFRPRPLANLAN